MSLHSLLYFWILSGSQTQLDPSERNTMTQGWKHTGRQVWVSKGIVDQKNKQHLVFELVEDKPVLKYCNTYCSNRQKRYAVMCNICWGPGQWSLRAIFNFVAFCIMEGHLEKGLCKHLAPCMQWAVRPPYVGFAFSMNSCAVCLPLFYSLSKLILAWQRWHGTGRGRLRNAERVANWASRKQVADKAPLILPYSSFHPLSEHKNNSADDGVLLPKRRRWPVCVWVIPDR